ncbi:MAG: hypothetical protein LAT81_12580 [Oceanicaulis sp.]|nr:hypothetical protein [Oceanicaulis sp.]
MIIIGWILVPVLGAAFLIELMDWPPYGALATVFAAAETLRISLRFTLSPVSGHHYALDALKETPLRAVEVLALGLCLSALAGGFGWPPGAEPADMAQRIYSFVPTHALPAEFTNHGPTLASAMAACLIIGLRVLRRRREPIRGARTT